jgi:SAM-dependent methyltransferase
VTRALDAFRPGGDVLELAAGTGWWTARLAPHARSVTAVDAAPEALARPGGRVFLIDSYHPERLPGDRQQRILNDGRRFEVVKRYWQPAELEAIPDWNLAAHVTANRHIIYAGS